MSEVFLDTSFAIALASPSDEYHEAATRLAHTTSRSSRVVVTTLAVLLEIGNALSRPPRRAIGIELLTQLRRDPDTIIVSMTDEVFAAAIDTFAQHTDKTWGLVDCVSFVVMQERGITDALTADRHFQQAGFRALLLGGDG